MLIRLIFVVSIVAEKPLVQWHYGPLNFASTLLIFSSMV